MNSTLDYYNRNSDQFAADTLEVKFTSIQDRFLSYLEPGAMILDFGCGAGRDSLYFASKGYRVEAVDGSCEMVRIASETSGVPVRQMLFAELDERDRYDGIFACASILHVPFAELPDIFARMNRAVKPGGVIYVSFKYGAFEGERSGRYFTDLNEERLEEVLRMAEEFTSVKDSDVESGDAFHLRIVERWVSGDARPGRESEKWFNAILRREA